MITAIVNTIAIATQFGRFDISSTILSTEFAPVNKKDKISPNNFLGAFNYTYILKLPIDIRTLGTIPYVSFPRIIYARGVPRCVRVVSA